jgi:hypothetical protein
MPQRFAEGFDLDAVKAVMAAFDKVCEALRVPPTHDSLTEQLEAGYRASPAGTARSGQAVPDDAAGLSL